MQKAAGSVKVRSVLMHGVSDPDAVLQAVKDRVHSPVSIKKEMSQADTLTELESSWPHEDWVTREEIPVEQCTLIAEALHGAAKKSTAAALCQNSCVWGPNYNGYSIRQVFKHIGNGQYMHWDGNRQRTTQEINYCMRLVMRWQRR